MINEAMNLLYPVRSLPSEKRSAIALCSRE